jgi:hypothetical protein
VSNSRLASTGSGDANEAYWAELYRICGVEKLGFVQTVIDHRRIRPFFNSGLVAVRRSAGLFRRWRADFFNLTGAGHVSPLTGMAGMDEFSLAAVLGGVIDRVRLLDGRYNYPLEPGLRPELREPFRRAQLHELVHVHYRFYFTKPGFLQTLEPPLDPESETVAWLNQYLPLKPLHARFQDVAATGGQEGPGPARD